jgi:type IV pilus assembly protein PilP
MNIKKYSLLFCVFFLASCSAGNFEDLVAFMAQIKAAPGGRIEPVPTFAPYKPFDYSAISLRAPFDRPVLVKADDIAASTVVDAPSTARAKELLEQVSIESLRMVGTFEKDAQLWALLRDRQGNVHPVKNGNYIGKNYGKIVATSTTYIQVVEIISNGANGWVERPRVLELKER